MIDWKRAFFLCLWTILTTLLVNFIIATRTEGLDLAVFFGYMLLAGGDYIIQTFMMAIIFLQYSKWLQKKYGKMTTTISRVIFSGVLLVTVTALFYLLLLFLNFPIDREDAILIFKRLDFGEFYYILFAVMVFINEIMIGRKGYS